MLKVGTTMLLRSNQPCRRPAYAPLEMVLALPFLVALTGMIFTVASAALTRGQVAVKARNAAWQEVPDQPANRLDYWGTTPASGTPILSASPDATVGLVHSTSSDQVRSYAGKALPGSFVATAETSVLRQSWDYRSIPIVAKAPLLPSDQLDNFVKAQLDFLTNLNNLKYLIQAINPKINGVSLQDLETLVKDLDILKNDAKVIVDSLKSAVKKPWSALGQLKDILAVMPEVVEKGGEVAGIVQKISNAVGANSGTAALPSSIPVPSVLDAIKLIEGLDGKVVDAIKQLPGAVTGIADIITKMTKSNDY
jgi:hypothetical protein